MVLFGAVQCQEQAVRLKAFGGAEAAVRGAVSWLSGVSQVGDALPAAASP